MIVDLRQTADVQMEVGARCSSRHADRCDVFSHNDTLTDNDPD